MSRIFVSGLGAVSPAGWGVPSLSGAMEKDEPIAAVDLPRPGWKQPLRVRAVPPPPSPPPCLAHPRLRRTGAMAQHTVAAALEAMNGGNAPSRVGIIVAMLAGVVTYTRRFYEEVMRDPAMASPVIFPETVFNAPASHLGAYLGSTCQSFTLVGDEGMFVQGLGLAARWIMEDEVDACLVIGVEELDWLVPDALRLFSRGSVYGSGAGALCLTKTASGAVAELTAVTDSFTITRAQGRLEAARKARAQLPPQAPGDLLCGSARSMSRSDAAENAAWQDWTAARMRPKAILGEAFAASAAWQCVAACDAVSNRGFAAANVSVVGANQQAIGARFIRCQNS